MTQIASILEEFDAQKVRQAKESKKHVAQEKRRRAQYLANAIKTLEKRGPELDEMILKASKANETNVRFIDSGEVQAWVPAGLKEILSAAYGDYLHRGDYELRELFKVWVKKRYKDRVEASGAWSNSHRLQAGGGGYSDYKDCTFFYLDWSDSIFERDSDE